MNWTLFFNLVYEEMWASERKAKIIHRNADSMDVDNTIDVMNVDETHTNTLDHRRRIKDYVTRMFPDDCALFNSGYLSNVKVPPVNSASDCIIVIADVTVPGNVLNNTVILKITFEDISNRYQVENAIYMCIANYDIPFVMQHLHTFYCSDFVKSVGQSNHAQPILQRWNALGNKDSNAQIIMCERGTGKSLYDTMRTETMSDSDWVSIFVQIVFTLAFFEEIGLIHHDLHLGNIWVDVSDRVTPYELFVDHNVSMRIATRYIIKIYDFDLSTLVKTKYNDHSIYNTFLDIMEGSKMGICNRMQIGRDFAQVCWHLWQFHGIPNVIRESIASCVDTHFLNNSTGVHMESLAYDGHPCKLVDSSCKAYQLKSTVTIAQELAKNKEKLHHLFKNATTEGLHVHYLPSVTMCLKTSLALF